MMRILNLTRLDFNTMSIFLLGIIYGIIFSGNLVPFPVIIKALIVFFLITCFGFGINDVFDSEVDKVAKKWNVYSKGEVSFKKGVMIHFAIAILALILAAIWLNTTQLILSFFCVFIFFFYSVPPVRFKSRAPFDLIINSLWLPLAFVFAFTTSSSLDSIPILFLFVIFFYSASCDFYTLIQDAKADKIKKINSFVVWFGVERTKRLHKFVVVAGLSFYLLLIWNYKIISVLSFPLWLVPLIYIIIKTKSIPLQMINKLYNTPPKYSVDLNILNIGTCILFLIFMGYVYWNNSALIF